MNGFIGGGYSIGMLGKNCAVLTSPVARALTPATGAWTSIYASVSKYGTVTVSVAGVTICNACAVIDPTQAVFGFAQPDPMFLVADMQVRGVQAFRLR